MRRRILTIIVALAVFIGLMAYLGYTWIYWPNTKKSEDFVLYLPAGSDYITLIDSVSGNDVLKNMATFELTARLMGYQQGRVRPGRYVIKPGSSNRDIITKLRIGAQDPVLVTISTGRKMTDIYAAVSTQIEADSAALARIFTDMATIQSLGLTPETMISVIIPNTYEMYWNVSPKEFLDRMKKEYDIFWSTQGRKDKCAAKGLSPQECATLASIVEKESNLDREKPVIAGVYLNRLERDIPLQADPTVVFAVDDFNIRRVLNKHLEYDSPYNTYKYPGLPPGPICLPSIASIDAVLNASRHDYLFFCAKPGYSSEHAFARTNREHEQNASRYRAWLNSENIRS